MSTFKNKELIQSVGFGNDKMYIELNNNRVLTVPYSYTKKLANASLDDLKDYRLIGKGMGIHFQKIDEDISLDGILRDFGDETKRINISVSASFLDLADQYAKKHHMSRSALLEKATMEYINL